MPWGSPPAPTATCGSPSRPRGRIGRITPTGTITEYPLTASSNPGGSPPAPTATCGSPRTPTRAASAGSPRPGRSPSTTRDRQRRSVGIVAGADGNLWFTENSDPGRIGRLDVHPTATTQAATGVALTSATLAGAANPNGYATTYHFEWGPTTGYGAQAPVSDAAVGSDSADHAVTQTLAGLAPSTTYHYRLVATSAAGTAGGADMSFVTPDQPSTLTGPLVPPTITTPPPGPITPMPPAPPAMGRSAVASVVSGTVLVRLPGSSQLVALGADQNIPLGALVNTTHGVVKMTNAIDRKGHTQSATLWAGSFTTGQARTGRGMTTFRIAGAPRCPTGHGRTARSAARKAPVRLWSNDHHGLYSTRGNNSVATVRGTEWQTVESCSGTRTVVRRGLVSVRELHRHKSVLVRAGHSYLAKR